MYFSYDYEDGIEFHDTAEEAKSRAEWALANSQDHACDCGWADEVWQICWGKVSAKVQEISREPADEDSEFTEIIDYQLVDTENAKNEGLTAPERTQNNEAI